MKVSLPQVVAYARGQGWTGREDDGGALRIRLGISVGRSPACACTGFSGGTGAKSTQQLIYGRRVPLSSPASRRD